MNMLRNQLLAPKICFIKKLNADISMVSQFLRENLSHSSLEVITLPRMFLGYNFNIINTWHAFAATPM